MIQKIAALVLVLAMVFTLVACGGGGNTDATGGNNNNGKTTVITFAGWGSLAEK